MKFKYRASWIASIEKYPYESETKNSVVIGHDNILNKTISYRKETADNKFCESFEDAKNFLISKHEKSILELENALKFARENLNRAQNLSESDVKDLTK